MQRNTIERAFELARSGECRTLDDLKRQLRKEHMDSVDFHLAGKSIKAQLTALMAGAKAGSPEPGPAPDGVPGAQ